MEKYDIYTKVLGAVQTNVYIIYNKATKDCVIIDPADEADKIIELISKNNFNPLAILLTHGHFDHISAADELRNKYNIKIYIGADEDELVRNALFNVALPFTGKNISLKPDVLVYDNDRLDFMGLEFKVITSPGHTKGSVCYFVESENILFSGDTIFRETCGRCDLYSGNLLAIKKSILEKLFELPNAVIVYPGHGVTTSIAHEKKYNEIYDY